MKKILYVILIAGFIGDFEVSSQPSAKIYYTDYGGFNFIIYKSNLDGTSHEVLTMPIRPYGIAVDWKSVPQKLYVGLNPTSGLSKIIRCNTDGSNIEDVITDLISVDDIELDLLNRKIYWAQDTYNDDKIYKADMDGLNSNILQIYSSTTAMVDLWGLALDVQSQLIWFTLRGSTCYSSSIRRMSTNGGGLNIIVGPVCNPHDIEYFNGKLYWSNADGLMRCETDGSNIDTILLGTSVHSLSMDATNHRIYWTDYSSGRVKRVDIDGTNATDISPILGSLTGIDTDYNPAATDVKEKYQQLITFYLDQNHPNPFNPSTTISWQSPLGSWQTIKLFDVLGREIECIVDGYYEAGPHSTLYIANSSLPSGVYFYQLKAGDFIQTKKMIYLK